MGGVNQVKTLESIEAQQLWEENTESANVSGKSPSTGRKSWAGEMEEMMAEPTTKNSIWDNFNISKVVNAGFKLEYVAPTN